MHTLALRVIGFAGGVFTCLLATALTGQTPVKPKPQTVDFNRDVRPILAQHCWACHGQDREALKKTGNMRLDTFAGVTQDRGGYKAIVPGDPDKSKLLSRVQAEGAMQMPPPGSGMKPLTKAQIETMRTWIKEGAEFRGHWAFVAPKMPALPPVSSAKWAKNPIDLFVMQKLDEAGLKPEPEADKLTLVRRATLAVTGLPPTPKEIDAFLADSKPDAYERLVDRLLASPRYGENQARYWLDAVRYADTHGLHIDNERAVYPYRDWVVRALNEDLPFDKFTEWQLAGDLLPNPTLDQKIATGYVRMNPTTNEGGVIEAEFLAKNTEDRVDTTSTIFLGLTLGCAKCHDHKFDPFTMKEYYSLYAFFDSTADAPLDGNLKLHAPFMKAPSPEQEQAMKRLESQIEALIDKTPVESAKKWASANAPSFPKVADWQIAGPYMGKDFDSTFAAPYSAEPGSADQAEWKPVKLELDKPLTFAGTENTATYVRTTLNVDSARTVEAKLSSDDGIKVWLNGKLVHENKVLRALQQSYDTVKLDLTAGDNALVVKVVNSGGGDGVFVSLGDARAQRLARASDLSRKSSPSKAEQTELRQIYYELGPDTADSKAYKQAVADQKKLDEAIPMTYVAQELPMLRETRLLKRGAYDQPGAVVYRGVPKVFGGLPVGLPKNRLGLAKWLTDPKNPLTSRVFVNRIWQQHFGAGIVKSAEDFGSRGDWPTHPELLDYLAVRFEQDGWSMKRLQRLILTSATYRQASTASVAKRAKDPENTWLSRAPRFRLDAEVIRDTALYVSGLLVERPGGRGDKPYQPSGLWEAIAYPISDTAKYMQDHGDALYRRSLYLFWKRTSPPPTMMLFDAPMRESCVVRRSNTNTPTQALATMNETGFFEASRAFAQRVLRAKVGAGSSEAMSRARLAYGFRLTLGRDPSEQERQVCLDLLAQELAHYRTDPAAAKKAISVGESKRDASLDPAEHAAWMIVCNMILNLDEALTQH